MSAKGYRIPSSARTSVVTGLDIIDIDEPSVEAAYREMESAFRDEYDPGHERPFHLSRPDLVYGLMDDDLLVGVQAVQCNQPHLDGADVLLGVYILPDYRGQGYLHRAWPSIWGRHKGAWSTLPINDPMKGFLARHPDHLPFNVGIHEGEVLAKSLRRGKEFVLRGGEPVLLDPSDPECWLNE